MKESELRLLNSPNVGTPDTEMKNKTWPSSLNAEEVPFMKGGGAIEYQ